MIRRLLAAVLGLLGAGLLLAAPAAAHASVTASDPADGSRLKAVPRTVTISFDEPVGLGNAGYVHVTDQTGRRVDARSAYHPGGDGRTVADDLVGGLKDGTYTVSFRVVSADSHPVAGTIRFVVGNGPLVRGSVASGSSADPQVQQAFTLARWLSYVGIALLGGGWLLLTVWAAGRDDRVARRFVWSGWGAAVAGAVLELLLQGPYAAGTGLTQLFSGSLVDGTLHTDYGQVHCLRLLLLGALGLLLARSLQPDARPVRWEWAVGGVGAVAVAYTFSASGHAATTNPTWLSEVVDMSHLLAMGCWLGGLVLLVGALLPRREPAELRTVLPVFSAVAMASVAVLVASGTYNAWRGIGSLDAVFGTTYGLLVVAKVVLLAGMLAVANLSRRVVRRRTIAYAATDTLADEPVEDEPDLELERLRRGVYVEAMVGILVLALSAVLVAQPRGREALAADNRAPVSATVPLGAGRTVSVTADPGVHGPVSVRIEVGGNPPDGTTVTATATQPKAQIGPLTVPLTREGGGVFDGETALPVAGRWRFDLVVTTSEFDATTADVTLTLH